MRIGLIEDNRGQRASIQRTLRYYYSTWLSGASDALDFKTYELSPVPELRDNLEKLLLSDILEEKIQSLIVDYKLDTLRSVLKGNDIVAFLHENVPDFPVVILTNAPEPSKKEDEIDPDKVYSKRIFLNAGGVSNSAEDRQAGERSETLAHNIFRNSERYVRRRAQLETELSEALNQLEKNRSSEEEQALLYKISAIEDDLGNYVPNYKTHGEKELDNALSGLQGVLETIAAIEEKLKE